MTIPFAKITSNRKSGYFYDRWSKNPIRTFPLIKSIKKIISQHGKSVKIIAKKRIRIFGKQATMARQNYTKNQRANGFSKIHCRLSVKQIFLPIFPARKKFILSFPESKSDHTVKWNQSKFLYQKKVRQSVNFAEPFHKPKYCFNSRTDLRSDRNRPNNRYMYCPYSS